MIATDAHADRMSLARKLARTAVGQWAAKKLGVETRHCRV